MREVHAMKVEKSLPLHPMIEIAESVIQIAIQMVMQVEKRMNDRDWNMHSPHQQEEKKQYVTIEMGTAVAWQEVEISERAWQLQLVEAKDEQIALFASWDRLEFENPKSEESGVNLVILEMFEMLEKFVTSEKSEKCSNLVI